MSDTIIKRYDTHTVIRKKAPLPWHVVKGRNLLKFLKEQEGDSFQEISGVCMYYNYLEPRKVTVYSLNDDTGSHGYTPDKNYTYILRKVPKKKVAEKIYRFQKSRDKWSLERDKILELIECDDA